jgi:hypothetical protein
MSVACGARWAVLPRCGEIGVHDFAVLLGPASGVQLGLHPGRLR